MLKVIAVSALVCSQWQAGSLCLAVSPLLGWDYDSREELTARIMPFAISVTFLSVEIINVIKSHFLISVW